MKLSGKFNKYPLAFKHFQRASLTQNLIEIYEGETISYATNDKSKCEPFIPFMKDSDNEIIVKKRRYQSTL